MSVIKVQGETYQDADELNSTIGELEAKLEEMSSDTPEHNRLAAHIDTLRAAAAESGEGNVTASPAAPTEPEPDTPPTEDAKEVAEQTHSLRDAADNGKEIICPLCGAPIEFPETPPADAFAHRCPDCDGWGQVLTGSRVDGHVWRDCKGCQGQGFKEENDAPTVLQKSHAAPTPEAPGATWNAERENWDPPTGQQPPWAGAVWDAFLGKWS
jgi:hypothetical protein